MVCCRNRAALLVAILLLGFSPFVSLVVQGAPLLAGQVIGHLTAETRDEAVRCGRAGPECAIQSYDLCPGRAYATQLITPFSRVAVAALEALTEGRPLGRMGTSVVNRWGVAILVSPAPQASNPPAIVRLEIQRQGQTIQPEKVTVGPITTILSDGSTRQSMRGIFAFAASAFEPSSDILLVFTGSTGVATCSLDRARLAVLR